MKIVINRCYGGFGLSEAAIRAYYTRKGKEVHKNGKGGTFATYYDAPKAAGGAT